MSLNISHLCCFIVLSVTAFNISTDLFAGAEKLILGARAIPVPTRAVFFTKSLRELICIELLMDLNLGQFCRASYFKKDFEIF